MIKVEQDYKDGYILHYTMMEQGAAFCGGIDADRKISVDLDCPYKEFMLRSIINAIMDTELEGFFTEDVWNVSLEKFGFKKENGFFKADAKDLSLPSDCHCHK